MAELRFAAVSVAVLAFLSQQCHAGDFTSNPASPQQSNMFATFTTDAKLAAVLNTGPVGASAPTKANYSEVAKVVNSVFDALNKRDYLEMSKYYSADPAAVFMGPMLYDETGRMVGGQNREEYFRGLATLMSFAGDVKSQRNNDEVYRVGDSMALWTSSGYNFMTWKDGTQTVKPWRWTMVLEKVPDGHWMIIHDHSSFGEPIQNFSPKIGQ